MGIDWVVVAQGAFTMWYALVALAVYRYTEGAAGENGAVWAWAIIAALFWPLTLAGAGAIFALALIGAPWKT